VLISSFLSHFEPVIPLKRALDSPRLSLHKREFESLLKRRSSGNPIAPMLLQDQVSTEKPPLHYPLVNKSQEFLVLRAVLVMTPYPLEIYRVVDSTERQYVAKAFLDHVK
jgi:hypothetical protein